MSGPFRTRRFEPVAPELRPRRFRRAARVIVTDGEATLLLADTDPGLPGSRWWFTTGGGIDAGESPVEAAARELAEETGLVVDPVVLLGPVAIRTVIHGYSDQVLSQTEHFFVLRVEARFEVSPAGLTADEQVTLDGWAWHPLGELGRLGDPVWPENLVELVALAAQPGLWPVELGDVEESTLPVN
ncbi:MAG: NUDIX domain-containing protein [Propionicimonas sp.]